MSIAEVQQRYARFAAEEAPGRSELYEAWAHTVATDEAVAAVIAEFEPQRRQPPLVFAVMRLAGAPATSGTSWRDWVLMHRAEILQAGVGRSVQTNEPLRCAALMPALADIAAPIALIEVGASAGLCLYPDRYGYRYVDDTGLVAEWAPEPGSTVTLESALRGTQVPPLNQPDIVWRAGIDVNPLDARDSADRAWLRALVWPGESGREERIAAALDIVAAEPPVMVAGDAVEMLHSVVDRAPTGARIVVTTPGVLPHIPRAGRERLIAEIQHVADEWITLDAPGLHEAWVTSAARVPRDGFALARNGVVLAAADPLGRWIEWFASPDAAS
ncbi:DUF2332 domain-containing protein [Microbacterium mitrae]|uniref:DUF2332 domain-containing protein n=1 Tax=Microbacterium mitrae TaxID=664640 RepID=A0A5C8HLT8_9MICO|nr:DUF2332 domain-containing protein [Microbacterium mitrae]TXK04448.1 DUF2332 domain-containing protein [Microbacterium mitrae]